MATITPVGYGDVYLRTPAGRGVAVFLMRAGISLFGLLTAKVAAYLVQGEQQTGARKLDQLLERLERPEELRQREQRGEEQSLAPFAAGPRRQADADPAAPSSLPRSDPP